ncbi:hypothetical protein [Roseomonas populi]|uniref:IstB-like ATP-binding protein domain-containing protein n=1 Tax=Roseomonas populi TaxID=3121582 RepID=A0ABT1X0X5_9PROT|nr:hypothetical protein [Roseomonas pecuniae]MCR0980614.1 hypothetical protein [Roseomonas pecuniae]
MGRPGVLEHICLPPSPVLLSDLLFLDRLGGQVAKDALRAVRRAASILRGASFLLIDDIAEFHIAASQVYAALSHDLRRNPRCT